MSFFIALIYGTVITIVGATVFIKYIVPSLDRLHNHLQGLDQAENTRKEK